MLKVQYERTFDDYVDFAFHRSRGLSSFRQVVLQRRCVILFGFGATAAALAYLVSSPFAIALAAVLAVAGGVFWVLIPKIVWKQVAAAVRSNVAELGYETTTVELALTEETLVMVTDAMRVEVPWDRMKSVEVVGDCTYINMVAGMAAVVVRDGFEEERDYFAVQKFALRKLDGEFPRND
ncbi:hypothetical protein [Limnoglobus roseus]|uniref:YcxB-like protein domain-containing protein n=1 Tax=Limnoglobus roseus TaxID=2598579 RepID=A0A5C1ANF6_9BACT|nr:hypothetical protein [Limnoglobus roseus]QEL20939.1 hypothetical protein PX52LOC_08065 [Limnoglobus roseus]